MSFPEPPGGWRLWNEEPEGRVILAYRPDVFTEESFPAECLPTIYLTNGARNRRPGAGQYETAEWHTVLFLEPEIEVSAETFEDREAAVTAAIEIAREFDAGGIDYRAAYQVPREAYFEKLDELTG